MYIKFKADGIFNGHEMLPPESVLVLHPDGRVADIIHESDAGEDIRIFKGLLSPGFINCHCHLELSHMRGRIAKQIGLTDFLLSIVENRHVSEEEIQEAIANAEEEMIQNGIVAVGDICNTSDTVLQKSKARLHYHNFIEAAGFPEGIAEKRFNAIKELYIEFEKISKYNSIVPHAPYSVSTSLLEKIISFAGNEIMTMHNQETQAENEFYEKMEGAFLPFYRKLNIPLEGFSAKSKSSLQHFLPYFKFNQPLILVHNVHTGESDIRYAQTIFDMDNPTLYFCLCPHANIYIDNQLPDVDMFVRNEVNLVLGTDSLASNERLSIWEEIKLLQHHFPYIAISEMLKWATINGARALKIDDMYGSFEVGKRPGVVLIEEKKQECVRLN